MPYLTSLLGALLVTLTLCVNAQAQIDPIPPADEPIDEPIFVGTFPMDSFSAGRIDRDLWAYKEIAFYAPPGEVPVEVGKQWIQWYAVTDDLYRQMSETLGVSDEEFDQVFRQNNGNLNRRMKRVAIVPDSCGVGCGNKNGAETTFGVSHFLQDPENWSLQGHWTLYYEMGRGGRAEPYYNRAFWPANVVLEPHFMAAMTFYDLGGYEGVLRGIPRELMFQLTNWSANDHQWLDFAKDSSFEPQSMPVHPTAFLIEIRRKTDKQTVFNILKGMSEKTPPANAEQGMCDFQAAVNAATNNQFHATMIYEWGFPSCGASIPVPTRTNLEYTDSATAYDSFDSTVGQTLNGATGGEGWDGGWSITTDAPGVVHEHLDGSLKHRTPTMANLPTQGNSLNLAWDRASAFRARRQLLQPITSGDVWFSYRIRIDRIPDATFAIGPNNLPIGKSYATSHKFRLGSSASDFSYLRGMTHNVVVKYELNPQAEDNVYLWVDPELTDEPKTENALKHVTAEIGPMEYIQISLEGTGVGELTIDEIRLGNLPTTTDSDKDGLTDKDEENIYGTDPTLTDTDGDGLTDGDEVLTHSTDPNLEDTDADNLGDGDEINSHNTDPNNPDSDGDGFTDGDEINVYGTSPTEQNTDLDFDNDGIPNAIEGSDDSDGDGLVNSRDLDSDNDGIPDILEAGGDDDDSNATIDDFTDNNADGLDDAIAAAPWPMPDTDGDGIANFLDLDSDQDTMSDLFEAGGSDSDNNALIDDTNDTNRDGWADLIAATPLPLTDTDGDGTPNYLDLDSDNDGKYDLAEAGGDDADNNGLADGFADADNDGIVNAADLDFTSGEDTDNDGIDDRYDASITLADDVNNNDVDDSIEPDADGDGWDSSTNNGELPDSNGNGIPDIIDPERRPTLHTGTGCQLSVSESPVFDPLLILMLIISVIKAYQPGRTRPTSAS